MRPPRLSGSVSLTEQMVMKKMWTAGGLLCLALACATIRQSNHRPGEVAPLGIPLRGLVIFNDGTPAAGATVTVSSACKNQLISLADDVMTDRDGHFKVNSFDSGCGTYSFKARDSARFWLPTGDGVFYMQPNGTEPQLSVSEGQVPDPVTLTLGLRGGELEFRVFDRASGSFIGATLDISRPPVQGRSFGAMSIATGRDGSSHTVLLPVGQFVVTVFEFPCGSKTYFARNPPEVMVEVVEGQRVSSTVEIDVRALDTRESYDNWTGQRCML